MPQQTKKTTLHITGESELITKAHTAARTATLYPCDDTFMMVSDSVGKFFIYGDDAARRVKRMRRTKMWPWPLPGSMTRDPSFSAMSFEAQIQLYGDHMMKDIISHLLENKYTIVQYPRTVQVEHPVWSHEKFRTLLERSIPASGAILVYPLPEMLPAPPVLPESEAKVRYEKKYGPVSDPVIVYLLHRTRSVVKKRGAKDTENPIALLPCEGGFVICVDARGKTIQFGDLGAVAIIEQHSAAHPNVNCMITLLHAVLVSYLQKSANRVLMIDPYTTGRFSAGWQYERLWDSLVSLSNDQFKVECIDDDHGNQ